MARDLFPEERTHGYQVGGDSFGAHSIAMGPDEELEKFNRLNQQVFRDYFAALREDDKYYRQEYAADVIPEEWREKGFKATVPPTAYSAVESASDHILTTPDIFVPVRPTTSNFIEEEEVAAAKSQFLEYWWHNVFIKGDPIKKGKKKLIKDGKIVLKKTIEWDFVDIQGFDLGVKKFLWRVQCVPNDTILEDPDNPEDPQYAYESYNIRVDEARRLFPEAKYEWTGKKGTDRVRYIEYWSKPAGKHKGSRKIWIDNEKVLDKDNPYYWVIGFDDNGGAIYDGYIPYHIRDSGWGDTDSATRPQDRYVGIIRYMHSTLDTEARQLSAADAQLRVTTFPPILLYGVSEDQEKQIRIGPGSKIHLPSPETQKIETLQWAQLDPSVWQILSRLHGYANDLAKFDQLGGAPQRGVDTATEAGMNVRQASSKLSGPISALQTLMVAINEQLFYDVEYILEAPVTVYGASESGPGIVTLTPEMIGGFCMNFVELKTTDQAALNNANMRLWADVSNVWRIDQKYAMTKAGIKNAQQRLEARASEDVYNDPRMHELRVMMALSGQGELGKAMAQRMLAAFSPAPGPAGPGGSFPDMAMTGAGFSAPEGTPEGTRAAALEGAYAARPDLQAQ